MRHWLVPLIAVLALLLAKSASAHLLPAQTATLNIVGDTVYCVVSVPVSALAGIDDDGSGGASVLEINRHSRAIAAQVRRRFQVSDPDNVGQPLMTMAWSPITDGPAQDSADVVVLHSVRFARTPQQPTVATDLFGSRSGEAQMTITAKRDKRGDTAEFAILRPGAASHRFFRGGLATFGDFVRVGIEHVLGGADHLLFVLTIIIAGVGWRYWLGMMTSFTVAHSLTLTLAALGLVRVDAARVELGIAASIVAMAVLNLWRGRGNTRLRLAIVFACGLLHGLGFASAIGTMAAASSHRLAMLAGFNVGIELAQFAFLGALLALAALLQRRVALPPGFGLTRLTSVAAATLGAVLLVGRALPVLPGWG